LNEEIKTDEKKRFEMNVECGKALKESASAIREALPSSFQMKKIISSILPINGLIKGPVQFL
jgi:hypothetical protein